jgi:hypothetical protein
LDKRLDRDVQVPVFLHVQVDELVAAHGRGAVQVLERSADPGHRTLEVQQRKAGGYR